MKRLGVMLLSALLLALSAAAAAAQDYPNRPVKVLVPYAPGGATDIVARILGDDVSSDALLWKEPALVGRVGFDDRLEVYRPPAVAAWADVIEARRPPLPGYDVLVASSRNELAKRILSLRGWRVLYDGGDGAAAARTR